MHSTPRKKRQRRIQPEQPAWPTHSRLGNPYPRGLEPVVIDDLNWRNMEQMAADDGPPGGILADYLYVEPDPQCPRLKLRLAPRGEHETDEQYASYQRDIEQSTRNHAVFLRFCQVLCTHLGNHMTCPEGPCRRNGACTGIRDQDRFDIPPVLFPPCVPLDHEITETYRQEIVAEAKRLVARGNEGGPLEIGGGAARKRKGHRALPVARPAKTA